MTSKHNTLPNRHQYNIKRMRINPNNNLTKLNAIKNKEIVIFNRNTLINNFDNFIHNNIRKELNKFPTDVYQRQIQ